MCVQKSALPVQNAFNIFLCSFSILYSSVSLDDVASLDLKCWPSPLSCRRLYKILSISLFRRLNLCKLEKNLSIHLSNSKHSISWVILKTVAKKNDTMQWGRKVRNLKWVEILFKVLDYIYFELNFYHQN